MDKLILESLRDSVRKKPLPFTDSGFLLKVLFTAPSIRRAER